MCVILSVIMKKLFLLFTFVLLFDISYGQVFDLKKEIVSIERIVSIDKDSLANKNIILLNLENDISVQIQAIDAITYRQLYNTYPGCKHETYSELHPQYYRDIRDGKYQSYVVYFRGFYRFGHVYDYDFTVVDIKDLTLNYYLVTYVSNIPNDGKGEIDNTKLLYVTLNDGKSEVNLKINTQFNPILGNVYCNDLVVKVRYGILEYFEVIKDVELKETIKAHGKIPTIT